MSALEREAERASPIPIFRDKGPPRLGLMEALFGLPLVLILAAMFGVERWLHALKARAERQKGRTRSPLNEAKRR